MARGVKNIGGDKKGINEGKNVSTRESHFYVFWQPVKEPYITQCILLRE